MKRLCLLRICAFYAVEGHDYCPTHQQKIDPLGPDCFKDRPLRTPQIQKKRSKDCLKCTQKGCRNPASRDYVCTKHDQKNCQNVTCIKTNGRLAKCVKHFRALTHSTFHAAYQHMDYDYLDKLSSEEQEFMEKFNQEYYLDSTGQVLDLTKKAAKKREQKSHSDSNARRRCLILKYAVPLTGNEYHNTENPTDALIEAIDIANGNKSEEE